MGDEQHPPLLRLAIGPHGALAHRQAVADEFEHQGAGVGRLGRPVRNDRVQHNRARFVIAGLGVPQNGDFMGKLIIQAHQQGIGMGALHHGQAGDGRAVHQHAQPLGMIGRRGGRLHIQPSAGKLHPYARTAPPEILFLFAGVMPPDGHKTGIRQRITLHLPRSFRMLKVYHNPRHDSSPPAERIGLRIFSML